MFRMDLGLVSELPGLADREGISGSISGPSAEGVPYEKWSWRERERGSEQKEAKIQNSRKSRSCCAKLSQLFLFLLAVSFGFTFSATAVHMGRKAYGWPSSVLGGPRTEQGGRRGGAGAHKEVLNFVQHLEELHIKAFICVRV